MTSSRVDVVLIGRHFSSSSQMVLDGNCLANLEVLNNQLDGSEKGKRDVTVGRKLANSCTGSLFWVLNHTMTAFGARLLRVWLRQPLLDRR